MSNFVQEIHMKGKNNLTDLQKKMAKDKLSKLHKEESKLVKGRFKNLEAPGGNIEFAFKMFPQDPLRIYTLEDGETYEIPLCVAKHLNNNCIVRQSHFVVDVNGNKFVDTKHGEQRYQFLSTEFM